MLLMTYFEYNSERVQVVLPMDRNADIIYKCTISCLTFTISTACYFSFSEIKVSPGG